MLTPIVRIYSTVASTTFFTLSLLLSLPPLLPLSRALSPSLCATFCVYCSDYSARQILRWHCFVCIQSNLRYRLESKNCSNFIYKSIIFSILAIGAYPFSFTFASSAHEEWENSISKWIDGHYAEAGNIVTRFHCVPNRFFLHSFHVHQLLWLKWQHRCDVTKSM